MPCLHYLGGQSQRRWLEGKLQAGKVLPGVRLFEEVSQGINVIILVGQVKNARRDLDVTPRKTIAGVKVELPKIVPRFARRDVVLVPPVGLELGEETARKIIVGKKTDLIERRILVQIVKLGVDCAGWRGELG